MTAPTDPFTLSAHLIDDHHQSMTTVEPMDSDELRSYHALCHSAGLPDHTHEEQP